MYDLSPYLFVRIGLVIRFLRHAQGFSVDSIIGEEKKLSDNLKAADFSVSCEGLSDLNQFINRNPSQMFATDVFIRLSDLAIYDVSEGFQCIVFSRPTAAAFHLLRATEATLRAYYCHTVKRKRVKPLMWGNMVRHLRDRRIGDENLFQRLDYIRNTYRNPTSHPEARYTLEQAQDLIGLCIDCNESNG